MTICPICGRQHYAGEVIAYGRFKPDATFQAPEGPLRATREEAQLDVCPGWLSTG